MQKLRSFLRSCFAYLASIYLFASFGAIPALIRIHNDSDSPARKAAAFRGANFFLMGLSYFIFLIPPILTGVFGAAWWTLKRGTRSARRWALAASAVMFLSALPLLPASYSIWKWENGKFGGMAALLFLLIAASLGGGIAGLYAFSRNDNLTAESSPRPPRVAGDGTHWFLDAVVWIVQVIGVWWMVRVYERWGHENGLHVAHGLEVLFRLAVVLLAVTFIHESAHAVVGIAAGMKLRSFLVGPFELRREDGAWQFHFCPSRMLSFSGATGIVSPDPGKHPWNEVAAIAAGPFANLLTGAVAAALVVAAPDSSWETWWECLALFAALSAAVCVSNLIPFQTTSFYSDGAHIYQLLFSRGPAADFARANRSVLATLVSPRRPRHYDIAAINRAAPHFTSGLQAMLLHLWAKSYFVDIDDRRQAAIELAAAENSYDESAGQMPRELLYPIVIYEALLNRNAEAVRKYWAPISGEETRRSSFYWLARCAFYWAENNHPLAQDALKQGMDHLRSLPDIGDNRFDLDQFRLMEGLLARSPDRSSEPNLTLDQVESVWIGA